MGKATESMLATTEDRKLKKQFFEGDISDIHGKKISQVKTHCLMYKWNENLQGARRDSNSNKLRNERLFN